MGTSLITNQSAMTALQTLRQVGNNMDTTQKRVSTGLQISEASDNTAYWSISSMMRSDRNALDAVSKAMALGKSQIDVAYGAVEKSKEYLDDIQKSLTTGYEKGSTDVIKIQENVKAKMNNIEAAIHSANLAEKNIIGNGGEDVSIAGAYRREGTAVYVDMIDVGGADLNFAKPSTTVAGGLDLSEGVLKDVFATNTNFATNLTDVKSKADDVKTKTAAVAAAQDAYDKADASEKAAKKTVLDDAKTALDGANTAFKTSTETLGKNVSVKDFAEADLTGIDAATLEIVLKAVQNRTTDATSNVVAAAAELGAAKDQVTGQVDYVSKLIDAIDKGIGSLVDADMNAESARLASLQVQQQLGIQALSIANQNGQNLLALFR